MAKVMLKSDLPQPMTSPHKCEVHSCNTVDIKNEYGFGHLQPMGWQNPFLNLTESVSLNPKDFYNFFYKPKIPYLVRNKNKIPKVYKNDHLLKKHAGNWKVIVEENNRIIHDHRKPFWIDWNFSKFLKYYKNNTYYMISPTIPSSIKIEYPQELTGCKILNANKGEERIWMSNGNTSSSLHFDTHDVFLNQIDGMKEIFLWEPYFAPASYMDFHTRYGLSPINTDKVDKIRFPEFSKYQPYFVDLYPGDMLYIPTLWWHQLRSNPGRNIMYTQEFELKISTPQADFGSSVGSYINVWETTLKNVPFHCKDKLRNGRHNPQKKRSKYTNSLRQKNKNNLVQHVNCPSYCDNPCKSLNGDYKYECKSCPDNFQCSKQFF